MTATAIVISGASSGIGAALALHHAGPGVRLVLWGRDGERLAAVTQACITRGASVAMETFDITDFAKLHAALTAADDDAPIALAYLNAGLGGSLTRERPGQAPRDVERMAGVNFTAPLIAANILAERMAARQGGHIVLVGSIAGTVALPMAPTYSATKAGLRMFAAAQRARLARFKVKMTLVEPGFIDTPMSRGLKEPRPFLISAERAAAHIARRVAQGHCHIVLPWPFAIIRILAQIIPQGVLSAALARFA